MQRREILAVWALTEETWLDKEVLPVPQGENRLRIRPDAAARPT